MNTRTATVSSGITTSLQTLETLFGASLAASSEQYRDCLIENQGVNVLYIASMERSSNSPTNADRVEIAVGEVLQISRLNIKACWISSVSNSGSNKFKFVGTPR